MKIVNQSKGPIFWSASIGAVSACGNLAESASKEVNFPDGSGSVGIRLKKGANEVLSDEDSYQRFPVKSGDLVTVQVLVNGVVSEAK